MDTDVGLTKELREKLQCGTIKILLPQDIAVMKIVAISQRGRKRDFVDLYWYCKNREPLDLILKRVEKQYPGQENNFNHILKSLTYFNDAENDPMPELFFKASWIQMKKFFINETVKVGKTFLEIPKEGLRDY